VTGNAEDGSICLFSFCYKAYNDILGSTCHIVQTGTKYKKIYIIIGILQEAKAKAKTCFLDLFKNRKIIPLQNNKPLIFG
jgi:hypothetical protein